MGGRRSLQLAVVSDKLKTQRGRVACVSSMSCIGRSASNNGSSDNCTGNCDTGMVMSLYRYVLTEVDDVRRVEAVDIGLELGEATYLGFGPSTNMNGITITKLVVYDLSIVINICRLNSLSSQNT